MEELVGLGLAVFISLCLLTPLGGTILSGIMYFLKGNHRKVKPKDGKSNLPT